MCGICGIIDYNTSSVIDEALLGRMSSKLEHRGPDDQGIFIKKGLPSVGLAHRRLSIIDLSVAGRQPISNEDGTIQIIFNGEIYNYKQLRGDLERKGHRFSSCTDTETVVHLYEEFGSECLSYLRGMFAFAIWDQRNESLFIARDRMGQKPLVYFYQNGVFCFASEFCALLEGGLIEKEVNEEAIHYYLTFGYIPAPLTAYKSVFKLPPAHQLILKKEKLTIERYWQLNYCPKNNIPEREAADEVLRLLKEAVEIRLRSDVPLGAFLSGGIDSSTIVALMSRFSSERVKTFSIGFQEKDYSELKYAQNIARKFNTEHNEFIVQPKAMEILPLLVERYGEPYADSSCVPAYYVSQQTRQFVTVALNGDGGDELFSGYQRYQGMLCAQFYHRFPSFLRKALSRVFTCLPDSLNAKNRLRNIRRFFKAAELSEGERYLRWVGIFDNEFKKVSYSDDFKRRVFNNDSLAWLNPYLNNEELSLLDRVLMTDTNTYLPDDLLVKVDIASMSNSLEARSPFLDYKLQEFVASLPVQYKMKGFVKKYLLKKIIGSFVPRENIYRRKMGFGLPVGEWFRGELKGFLSETILSKRASIRRYFKDEAIQDIFDKHTERKTDYTFQFWALLMLELWHKRFIES